MSLTDVHHLLRPRAGLPDLPELRRRTSDLLHSHVPLTLLLDLADPCGPDSAGRYREEAGDTSWLRAG